MTPLEKTQYIWVFKNKETRSIKILVHSFKLLVELLYNKLAVYLIDLGKILQLKLKLPVIAQ